MRTNFIEFADLIAAKGDGVQRLARSLGAVDVKTTHRIRLISFILDRLEAERHGWRPSAGARDPGEPARDSVQL